jgi:hypothetical protein
MVIPAVYDPASLIIKTLLRMLLLEAREEWNKENWSQRAGRVPSIRLAVLVLLKRGCNIQNFHKIFLAQKAAPTITANVTATAWTLLLVT